MNERVDGATPRPSRSEIAEVFARILGIPCHHEDNFFDLGGDSLNAEELIMDINSKFRIDIPVWALLENPSVSELTDFIAMNDLDK